ncbi:hypothetical protein HYU15_00310 [Candidatus Woesearchaeota archaeon]|nr:hypothetical protein [Candidatus Woesearchaeota archaeon]
MPSYELLKDGFQIGGKTITVVFVFQRYWRKYLQDDYEWLKQYHRRQLKLENPQSDIDLKFYHAISRFPEISYDYFKDAVRKFCLQIIHKVLSDNPSIITTTTDYFEVQLKVVMVKERQEYYMAYDESLSDTEHALVELNGLWLLNTIVLPWMAFQRIDYKPAYKLFEHEMGHHFDWIERKYRAEDYAMKRINPLMRRIGNYSLFYLYLAFESLRVEGFQEFNTKKDMQSIDVDMSLARAFRRLVEELSRKRKIHEASEFYDKNLGSASHQGIYYVGRLACQTIALAIAKQQGVADKISIMLPNGSTEELSNLNSVMSRHQKFRISKIPDHIFQQAAQAMQAQYRQFIRIYEGACNELGISARNRIVTYAWFDDLKKRATKYYTEDRLKRMAAKGFAPLQYTDYWEDDAA